MKILLVIKRFSGTTGKDAVEHDFGREMRFAQHLGKKHTVTIIAADHLGKKQYETEVDGNRVIVVPFGMRNLRGFVRTVKRHAKTHDVVIGTTHPIVALLALQGSCGKPFVYDLRDNYETYDISSIPGLRAGPLGKQLTRLVNWYVLRHSDLGSFVSQSLRGKYSYFKRAVVVPNGVEPIFKPMSKAKARRDLKLPKSPIIAYVGSLTPERGGTVLLRAFREVQKRVPDVKLLVSDSSGRHHAFAAPGIINKTLPKRREVVTALNAADVLILPQPVNETTKYTFPYKLMEYLACDRPVVATAIGDVKRVLQKAPQCLVAPGDVNMMAERIVMMLRNPPKVDYRAISQQYTWEKVTARLERKIQSIKHIK